MSSRIGGLAGLFDDEGKVLKAAAKCRDMGFVKFDAITPYPVHGMEEAVGIKRSVIPWVTFFGGLSGMFLGLGLQVWISAYDWPLNIGGKPYVSLPAFIPIIFELTILIAALSSVVAFGYFSGVPTVNPPVIDPDLTCHKFAVFVPTNEAGYDETKLSQLFKDLGAIEVKKVAEY